LKTRCALRVLNEEEMDRIHALSLQILEEVGVKITHERALRLFKDGGCNVDEDVKRVRIPEDLTTEIIKRNTGRELKLYFRDSNKCVRVNEEPFFSLGPLQLEEMMTGTVNAYTYNVKRLHRRPATREDVKNAAVLADALGNIKTVGIPLTPYDALPETRSLHALSIIAQYTSKPISWLHIINLEMAKLAVRVEAILAGGIEGLRKKPTHTALLEAISPLRYDDRVIDLLFYYAEQEIPAVSMSSMPLPGLTAPMSIPASIAQGVAEIIPGLYLLNLANPAIRLTPAMCLGVCYGPTWATDVMLCDPHNLRHIYAAPEETLVGLAESQLIREFYGFPVWGARALRTDAKRPGIQATLEKTLTGTLAMLAGATGLGPAGQLDSDQIFCFEQLVMDNETMNLMKSVQRGIPVNPEDFEVERIKRGVEKGSYLTDPLTLKRVREMVYTSELLDRERYEEWIKGGKKDMLTKAHEEVQKILKCHEPRPQIDRQMVKEIGVILKEADKKFTSAR